MADLLSKLLSLPEKVSVVVLLELVPTELIGTVTAVPKAVFPVNNFENVSINIFYVNKIMSCVGWI